MARGFATKEIADRLGISARTVSLHLQHIYGKLHVRSRTEAALKYRAASAGAPPVGFPVGNFAYGLSLVVSGNLRVES